MIQTQLNPVQNTCIAISLFGCVKQLGTQECWIITAVLVYKKVFLYVFGIILEWILLWKDACASVEENGGNWRGLQTTLWIFVYANGWSIKIIKNHGNVV